MMLEKITAKFNKETKQAIKETGGVVKNTEKSIDKKIEHNRRVFRRHPFLLGFLGTLGLVFIIVGFENTIKSLPYLYNNPLVLILFGIILLVFTGALYKRLQEG